MKTIHQEKKGLQVTAETAIFSGPIPHPRILEQYEKILPGSADRIIKMSENQSNHRQRLENFLVGNRLRNEMIGMLSGFVLAIVTIVGGIWCILIGKALSGLAAVITPLIGLVSVFIYTKISDKQNKDT